MKPEPVSVYVHLPFCAVKCGYCDFFSVPAVPAALRARVLAALRAELAAAPPEPAATLYLGGGDPGSLTDAETETLFALLAARFPPAPGCEWTVELRPDRVTPERLEQYLRLGVNRLSLGVQSFSATERETLGRRGDDAGIARALAQAGERFDNWNLDLIYGIPGQTGKSWDESLARAVAAGPPHLSLYALTIAEETPLGRRVAAGDLILPDEETVNRRLAAARAPLAGTGYRQYEISNWAKSGYECRHNLNYWRGGDWLAFGPGAVGTRRGERRRRSEDLERYAAAGGAADDEVETLDERTRLRERVMLGLRLAAGLDLGELRNRFGWEPRTAAPAALAAWTASGHLESAAGRLRLTPAGQLLASTITADLLP